MNVPPVRGGAPEWLRELAAARTYYEELIGWPVTIEVTQQCLAAPVGGVLDAVTMPAALGEKVLVDLQLMMQAGPVIAQPDEESWAFFTQPVVGWRYDVPAELNRLQVRFIPGGTYVAVPTRLDTTGLDRVELDNKSSGLRWLRRPCPPHLLPPSSVVLGATRRVAERLIGNESDLSVALDAIEERRVLLV